MGEERERAISELDYMTGGVYLQSCIAFVDAITAHVLAQIKTSGSALTEVGQQRPQSSAPQRVPEDCGSPSGDVLSLAREVLDPVDPGETGCWWSREAARRLAGEVLRLHEYWDAWSARMHPEYGPCDRLRDGLCSVCLDKMSPPPAPTSSPRPGPLSADAKAARAPMPPEMLVGANHDRVHLEEGRLIKATPIGSAPSSPASAAGAKCKACNGTGSVSVGNSLNTYMTACPACTDPLAGMGDSPPSSPDERKEVWVWIDPVFGRGYAAVSETIAKQLGDYGFERYIPLSLLQSERSHSAATIKLLEQAATENRELRERVERAERCAKWNAESFAEAHVRVRELEAAIDAALSEWLTSHTMHWDERGTAGANCPACKLDRELRERLRALPLRATEEGKDG